MWDDGNANRMGKLLADQESASSRVITRSLRRLKRSISSAVDKLKGRQP